MVGVVINFLKGFKEVLEHLKPALFELSLIGVMVLELWKVIAGMIGGH